MKGLRTGAFKALFSIIALIATMVASGACAFLLVHDGGDEVKLPKHLAQ